MFKILAAEYLDMSTVIEPTVADNENEAIFAFVWGCTPALFGLGRARLIGEALAAWRGCTPRAWWE